MDRKTYGRTEVRPGISKKQKKVIYRFIAYTMTVAIIAGLIGYCVGHKKEVPEDTEVTTPTAGIVEATTPDLDELVNKFGTYDDRKFTSEVSRDWGVGDLDFTPVESCPLDDDTQEFIYYMCEGYNIDFYLVLALIKHESNFQSDCISSTNDYGLMQINECNHEWLTEILGVTDYLDAEENIRAGLFVLRKLFEEYQDTNMVLMVYNMGADNASSLWEKGVYSTSYTDVIEEYQEEFRKEVEGE